MAAKKPIEFNGTAGQYLQLILVTLVFMYIPLLGWAFLLNYDAGWFAQHSTINGRAIVFRASYLQTLKFVVVSALLLLITLGIYTICFVPKLYRYLTEHIYYADDTAEKPQD